MIALVDLKIGNLGSVLGALARVGVNDVEPTTPESIARADAVVLPGVGAYNDAMASLRRQGLEAPLRQAVASGVPLLGICLGMQLFADVGTEHGESAGLGLLAGSVERLRPSRPDERVPNVGWCDVTPTRTGRLFPDETAECFYHVHSYHFVPRSTDCVAATIEFGEAPVVVAVEHGNLMGVQFHPEKSQDSGLDLLARFFRISGR